MFDFKIGEKNFKFITSWDEVDLETYIKIAKMEEQRGEIAFDELYLLKLLEYLSKKEDGTPVEEGDLDEMDLDMVNELSGKVLFIKDIPTFSKDKEFDIDGVVYSSPDDFKKLSIGEFVSIKTYQQGNTNAWDAAPWVLAILWRPSTKVWDAEKKEWTLQREPFKVENLEWRKNLLLKQPALKMVSPLLFFSIMNNTSKGNTEDYLKIEQKEMVEIGDPETTS